MKDRLDMLEELQEELEMLDEAIWDVSMRIEDIELDDYAISSKLSRIASRIEDARERTQDLLSEVLMEIEQYEY